MEVKNNKRVLVLGAGRGQIGLIKAAKRLGYHSIVASIDGDYPGFVLADEKYIVNIADSEGVSRAAAELKVDGVVTAGMDLSLPALGRTCEDNGLPGLTATTAELSSNKLKMKEAFMAGGVLTARFVKAAAADDVSRALIELNMPLIVKPVDMGGSRGINIVFEEAELQNAFERTMSVTRQDYCIIEEYIDGYEVSATAFVAGGDVKFVLPMGDVRYGDNDEMPIGHYVPLDCGNDVNENIVEQVELAIKAIGIDNCAVNADLMIMNGMAYVLELTGRLGANAIPEITSAYYGRDIHEFIVEAAVGNVDVINEFDFKPAINKVVYAQMLVSDRPGTLRTVTLGDENCDEWFFLKKGDSVNAYRNPKDCIGQVVVIENTKEECEKHVGKLLEKIVID